MLLPPKMDERKWSLARQVGVDHVWTKATPELSGKLPPYDYKSLKAIKDDFNEAGFTIVGLEGDQFDMSPIKLGLERRDEWIEKYRDMLRNMARLDIRTLCYNWMAVVGWFRTRIDVLGRGGALVSEFKMSDTEGEIVANELQISEDKLWDNLYYFLDAVLPVAEEVGIQMALHPDDPPVSPLKGVGRILTSSSSFDRIFEKYPSPNNGLTFCQATFATMGEDIQALAKKWIPDGRVFFLHLRDVEGNKNDFRETFHDNGPTSMVEMLRLYHELSFTGPLRPDHAPAMYGEGQESFASGLSAGYEILGKIFAMGYLKGICEALDIPVE